MLVSWKCCTKMQIISKDHSKNTDFIKRSRKRCWFSQKNVEKSIGFANISWKKMSISSEDHGKKRQFRQKIIIKCWFRQQITQAWQKIVKKAQISAKGHGKIANFVIRSWKKRQFRHKIVWKCRFCLNIVDFVERSSKYCERVAEKY